MTEEFVCGAIPSPADARDYVAHVDKDDFPSSFQLNMPEVKYQGSVGSCVAHAITIAAECMSEKETNHKVKLSTGILYGNRTSSSYKGAGMIVRDALKDWLNYGLVRYELFPENTEVPYAIERFEAVKDSLQSDAKHFKIKSFAKITDTNTIKQYLISGAPVILSMTWYKDMKVVNGVMKSTYEDANKKGGHCMAIYGWNETGWLVQNSWGTLWGDGGKFILPYDAPIKETWGVTDDKTDVAVVINKPEVSNVTVLITKIYHTIYSWIYNFKKTKTTTQGE